MWIFVSLLVYPRALTVISAFIFARGLGFGVGISCCAYHVA